VKEARNNSKVIFTPTVSPNIIVSSSKEKPVTVYSTMHTALFSQNKSYYYNLLLLAFASKKS
jgi:hypothetical protein